MPYLNLKNNLKVRPIRIIFIFYWFLLAYILAALIFWFIALNRQNNELTELRLHAVNVHEVHFIEKVTRIENEKNRKTAQYIGEGATFLLMILAGAGYFFRTINKQLTQSAKQKNFMLAITHELKTPVAVTKLNLETMKIRKLDLSQQQKLIKSTIEEANRLDNLCNNMLFMSQLDSGASTLTKERFDFSFLVDNCVEDFMMRFPERKIEFSATEEILIKGDKLLLQLAINNLLDNAIKYSGKDDVVLVKVFKQNKKIILRVADEGMGVNSSEKEKIFEKYFRGSGRQAKGTGLGLYLTREIIRQHNGTITMKNNELRGSTFEIQIRASKNI